MLRQLFIFHNQKLVFNHSLALALGENELVAVLDVIKSYIIMPMPGKTFHLGRKTCQIFHRGLKTTYFILVTDLIDTLEYIDEKFKSIILKFNELFPNPSELTESSSLKSEFLEYIYNIQKDLHSKIAIIGPLNSGKSTLYNMLKSGEEKSRMGYAMTSSIQIDDLYFDLWDYTLTDNFSPMLNSFIGSADLIIFLFDSSSYNMNVIDHFKNLIKTGGRFSKTIIMANKRDLISEEEFEIIKKETNISDLKTISLIEQDAKSNLLQLVKEGLNLKKKSEVNFDDLINEAKKLQMEGKISAAIEKYENIIKISEEVQNFMDLDDLEKEINELKEKQIKEKKRLEIKKKFSGPEQIKFTQKILVKNLPTKEPTKTRPPQKPTVRSQPKAAISKPTPAKIPPIKNQGLAQNIKRDLLKLKLEDVKINISKQVSKPKNPVEITKVETSLKPVKIKNGTNNLKIQIEQPSTPPGEIPTEQLDNSKQLQKMIEERGSALNSELCKEFIKKLEESLEEPITINEIKIAVDNFCTEEKDLFS